MRDATTLAQVSAMRVADRGCGVAVLTCPSPPAQCQDEPFRSSLCVMGYKVHVHMRQPPNRVAIDVGEAELGLLPGILAAGQFRASAKLRLVY
jgi:hypothetical protein